MDFPRNSYIEIARGEGRSQKFIEDTLNYADKLILQGLPVIFSLNHFAQIIGIDILELKRTLENRGHYYSYYLIKKKKGGYRRIIAPHKNIKYLQDWLKLNILDKLETHSAAKGFIKNKSIYDNAKVHLNADTILNVDLNNFFESISEKRVYGLFRHFGYHPNLAVHFAKICTVKMPEEKFENLDEFTQSHFQEYFNIEHSVLVQGAPTSPTLSNLACLKLDNRLNKLSNKAGINYSRYADDMTFSGEMSNLPKLSLLKKIIEDENFKINWRKVGKFKQGQKQLVTGLLINKSVRIPKKFKRDVLRHLHFCEKFGPKAHFDKVKPGKLYRKEWLMGKILFINSIEPEVAKNMFEKMKKISWEV